MKNFKLRTRYRNIEVVKHSDISQVILTSSVCGQLNLEVFNLPSIHYEKLVSYTSLPLLLAYAKRHQIPSSICLADDYQDIRQCSNCEHDDQCAKQLAYLATDTLCPCPPENSEHIPNTDKAELDGGILSIAKRLKEIKEQINLINGSAFENNTLTDAQHYQLLDVEMFIEDFIAPYAYREVIK